MMTGLSFGGGNSTGNDAVATTGAEIALPTGSAARKLNRVVFQSDTPCYVRLTQSGVTHLAAVMHLHIPTGGPLVIGNALGWSHIYVRAVSGTSIVRISPLEG